MGVVGCIGNRFNSLYIVPKTAGDEEKTEEEETNKVETKKMKKKRKKNKTEKYRDVG